MENFYDTRTTILIKKAFKDKVPSSTFIIDNPLSMTPIFTNAIEIIAQLIKDNVSLRTIYQNISLH